MKTLYFIFLIFLCLLFSCAEKKLEPLDEPSGKPGIVTEVDVTPIAGGAIIAYRIPESEDILSVKAVYTLTNGRKREAEASFYANKLVLEGFNDTREYEAVLYTINRAQEMSDAVSVKFTPLESPLNKAVKTVNIVSDFGGANFSWKNKDRVMLTLEFLTEDDASKALITSNIISSGLDSVGYTLRGFPPEPRKFAMIMSDNWGNVSDTIYPATGSVTPYLEEKLDKKIMKVMILDNDQPFNLWGSLNEYLIDDNIDNFGHTANGAMPDASFTLKLGNEARLSRVVMHQRATANNSNLYYQAGNPLTFDVYGCATEPSQSGVWSEWTKLMSCTIEKPSGLAYGQMSDEDLVAAIAGHEFSFPLGGPLRYLRFVVRTTWTPSVNTCIGEVTCYGGYVE